MAFGPVNAGGGASGRTMEEINEKIRQAKEAADTAARDLKTHKEANNPHGITAEKLGAVPVTRKINSKPLSGDITLTAQDVGAAASGHSHTAQDVGAAPANHGHSFESLSGRVFHAETSAPANTGLLWIDTTANTGGLKYHNGSAWVHVPVSAT